MNDPEIRITDDGSHTLWLSTLNESYHSKHGAITESQHVFITHGLRYFCDEIGRKVVNVLEVGFGTGLNTLITCYYSQEERQRVKYTTLEPHPLDFELIGRLNYTDHINHPQSKFWFYEIHKSPWGQIEWMNPYFSLLKKNENIQDHSTGEHYDICFFDAFAPTKQPEIWEPKVLEVIRRQLKRPGMLVTYAAQGHFKRNLKMLGFEVESLPGPPGKKEMTRAFING